MPVSARAYVLAIAIVLAAGCGGRGAGADDVASGGSEPDSGDAEASTTAPTSADASASSTSASVSDTSSSVDTTAVVDDTIGDGPKFDMPVPDASVPPPDEGCAKVDFLFVVDSSLSMSDEQENLVNSFAGFITAIEETVAGQDHRIMVIDTDAQPQVPVPGDACDHTLGAGKVDDKVGVPCGIEGGNRYVVDGQTDLEGTFACLAEVGTGGSGNEQQTLAMRESIGPLAAPGECNEDFLRDDAVLVITIISDEEDDPNDIGSGDGDANSPGDPPDWKQAILDLKAGSEGAVVLLALVGDTDLPGATCGPFDTVSGTGAEPAPRLRELADSFTFGMWGSVCAPDYAPFFDQAVSVIDVACDEFRPPR